jgi:hypothetical protein
MPLKAINLEQKYPCVLGTIGPAKEEWGSAILEFVDAFWKGQAIYSSSLPPRLKFETSNEGYPHFHIGLMFQDRQKFRMFVKKLQTFMSRYKKDKPHGYDKAKEFSIRLFAVPCSETVNQKILRGPDLINHYLDNPTKEKSIEGGNYEIELEGFNISKFIEEADPVYDKAELRKYVIKYQKSKLELPPLDDKIGPGMICNRPGLEGVATRWLYSRLNPKNQDH